MVTPYSSIIFKKRSGSEYVGVPSNITTVAPFASGPYTTYECPVTQPISAEHQYTSSSLISKTYLQVRVAYSKYPPVVCRTPLGLPVLPDVYRINKGSSASISTGVKVS